MGKKKSHQRQQAVRRKLNVLLLCLSKINDRATKQTYLYRTVNYITGKQSDFHSLKGYMTNEPPAKYVLEQLKANNQRLDKVLMICSKDVASVYKPKPDHMLLKDSELLALLVQEDPEHRPCSAENFNRTPSEYYQAVVNAKAKELNKGEYGDRPIEYIQIPSPNVMSTGELSKTVIEAADLITAEDIETDLYIDFNGGPRDVAFMIYSLSSLMKLRNVTVRQILTMNYENPEPELVDRVMTSGIRIEVRNAVFESVDLIAGINEYVKYGRIQGLRSYFDTERLSDTTGAAKESSNTVRKQLLDQMEEFAGNLQLCRTDYIMSHKEDLNEALSAYSEQGRLLPDTEGNYSGTLPSAVSAVDDAVAKERTIHDQLFGYVIKDIQRGYHGLLDGELPDIIDWCVRHDYIQQAVTFCSEKLPWYFWNKGICGPTDAEAQEYWTIRDAINRNISNSQTNARGLNKGYYSSLPSHAAGELSTGDARYAYEWLISYLPMSGSDNYTSFIDALPSGEVGPLSLRSIGLSPREKRSQRKNRIMNYMKPGNGVSIHVKDAAAAGQKILEIVERNDSYGNAAVGAVHSIMVSKKQIENAAGNAAAVLFQRDQGRVRTNVGDQKLREILLLYYLLKDQRNELNHADGSTEGWPFLQLREAVFHMARLLRG